uniref:F-box domain-containing protein n=1 Tax=Oryza glumipatula TaxID=40148 RepID=A0A0E0B4V2_9ORYZ
MASSRTIEEECETVGDDRISALPDDILQQILERLDLPMAIRTSTLSRRWLQLPRLLSHLIIDITHFMPAPPRHTMSFNVDQIMAAYTAAVNNLLLSSPSSSNSNNSNTRIIKRMQLSFFLSEDPSCLCSIGDAVGAIVDAGKIALLKFSLWSDVGKLTLEHCQLLRQRFMSFSQSCPVAFRWLTNLALRNLAFQESDVSHILNTCHNLKFLALCSCVSDFVVLKIDAPHSKLLTLEIVTCEFDRVDLIHLPNLRRVVYWDWCLPNPPIRFGNVPCLHNMSLSCSATNDQTPFRLTELISSATNLTILYRDFQDQMIWIELQGPKLLYPVFSNVRDVYLCNIFYECDLNWTVFVLEAAPRLSNFYLKVPRYQPGTKSQPFIQLDRTVEIIRYLQLCQHPCERNRCEDSAEKVNLLWDQMSSDFKHPHLNLLEITGFAMDDKMINYTRLIMERAVNLKRIRLLDQVPCDKCNVMNGMGSTSSNKWRFPVDQGEKSLIKQKLIDGFSSSAEITIG